MVAVPAQRWLIAVTLVLPLTTGAAPREAEPVAGSLPAPSKEMLLYLAEFEDADGQWVDPLEVTREDAFATATPPEAPVTSEPTP